MTWLDRTLVEGFLSFVFLWLFMWLTVTTAILFVRGVDALAVRILAGSRSSREAERKAIARVEAWMTLVDEHTGRTEAYRGAPPPRKEPT